MPRRRKITKYRAGVVFKRDHATCQACGFFPRTQRESERLELDHVVPIARGGSHTDVGNLQVLCGSCNNDKSILTMTEFMELRSISPTYYARRSA
jgi:5-methylcytosine-specific restriction endonuclease McrA